MHEYVPPSEKSAAFTTRLEVFSIAYFAVFKISGFVDRYNTSNPGEFRDHNTSVDDDTSQVNVAESPLFAVTLLGGVMTLPYVDMTHNITRKTEKDIFIVQDHLIHFEFV